MSYGEVPWWLITYRVDDDNRWALFDDKTSAYYFYNRLADAGPYRYIRSLAPSEVARRLSSLVA